MSSLVAFISEGILHTLSAADTKPAVVSSPYVEQLIERAERDRERNSWKQSSSGWNFALAAGAPPWAFEGQDSNRVARFIAVAPAGEGNLVYALQTSTTTGLFARDFIRDEERRIFHKMETRAGDIALHPASGRIALTIVHPDGTSHLGLTSSNGGGIQQITEGDCFDAAPCWHPSSSAQKNGTVLYHSSGVGRDRQGMFSHLGPCCIMRLDLDTDTHETLVESGDVDCLCPKVGPDNSLYFIQRPYMPFGKPPGVFSQIKDVALMPFRMVEGMALYYRMFADMMKGRPHTPVAGPYRKPPEQTHMHLWGRFVELERLNPRDKTQELRVPASWQLVRRDSAGQQTVVRDRVACFDIARDGTLVTTDGASIISIDPTGAEKVLHKSRFIEKVIAH